MRYSTINPFEGFGNIEDNIKEIIEENKLKEENEFKPEDFNEDRNDEINLDEIISYGNEYQKNLRNNLDKDKDKDMDMDMNMNMKMNMDMNLNMNMKMDMDFNLDSNLKISSNEFEFQTEQKNLGIDLKIMKQFNKKNKKMKLKFNDLVKKLENEYDPSEIFYRILSLAQTNKLNIEQNELFNNDEITIRYI
jgi:hypothetical protein